MDNSNCDSFKNKVKSFLSYINIFDIPRLTREISCDVNSNTLEAHHILPYTSNEDMRTDVSNGVTMCRKHHAEFHSIYGRASIGKEELEEFMKGFKSK